MTAVARWIVARLLPCDIRDAVLEDLDAEYTTSIRPARSWLSARWWYWRQLAGSVGPALSMRRRRSRAEGRASLVASAVRWASEAMPDARFAVRLLGRQKTFTLAAVATLALGIGATTAVFSLVDGVLLRPLPYRDPDRLIRIWSANPRGIPRNQISPADFFDWREQAQDIDGLAAFGAADVTLTSAGEPVRLTGATVTANLADTLGVRPLVGRWFVDGETRGAGEPVAVLDERLWRERFGAAPDIVGRSVTLDGRTTTVVGVMPRTFEFPTANERIWLPLPARWRAQPRSAHFLGAIARLRDGVTIDVARDRLRSVTERLASTYPESDRGWGVTVMSLRNATVGDITTPLLVLLAAVAAVLLIACANVASLNVARGISRSRELAVRAALGASAARLLRMQFVESLLLSLVGGAAGIALASWCLRWVQLARGLGVPLVDRVDLDVRVAGAALAMSFACALVTGLWPAWKASRQRGAEALSAGTRTTDPQLPVRQAIVFAQIAIATMLLAGGALLVTSFYRLMTVQPGFHADRTMLADVSLPVARYSRAARAPFFARLLERVAAVPGVEAAAAGGPLPLSGLDGLLRFGLTLEGRIVAPDRPERAYVRWATPQYFRAMGIEVSAGRVFADSDTAASAPVAVVDADLARRYFDSENPIGRRVKTPIEPKTWREIIGVVGTVRQTALDRESEPHLYVPQAQLPSPELTLVVRGAGDPTALTARVREQLRGLDADLPLSNVRTLADLVAGSAEPRRVGALLLSVFAAIALLLTLVGVYGAVAQVVAQSTKEIGVRIAMGATRHDVVSLFVRRALRMALGGVMAGSLLAWLATPALRSMLYGITPHDPSALLGAGAILTLAASLAAYLPARRVLRLDVINALRVD